MNDLSFGAWVFTGCVTKTSAYNITPTENAKTIAIVTPMNRINRA
jgi:hypothetical protein